MTVYAITNSNGVVWGSTLFSTMALAEAELRHFWGGRSAVPKGFTVASYPLLDAITGDYAGMEGALITERCMTRDAAKCLVWAHGL